MISLQSLYDLFYGIFCLRFNLFTASSHSVYDLFSWFINELFAISPRSIFAIPLQSVKIEHLYSISLQHLYDLLTITLRSVRNFTILELFTFLYGVFTMRLIRSLYDVFTISLQLLHELLKITWGSLYILFTIFSFVLTNHFLVCVYFFQYSWGAHSDFKFLILEISFLFFIS